MKNSYTEAEKMRSYSTVFSSSSFHKVLKGDSLSFIQAKVKRFDEDKVHSGEISTYLEYVRYIYDQIAINYRNEYVYKNSFINTILLEQYGVTDTVAINEFRVGNSIADIVLFNGAAKAFEIKTGLDNDNRLHDQMADYSKIFDECYIVTDKSLTGKYLLSDETSGIIELHEENGLIKMQEIRKAKRNESIDSDTLIRSIRTPEYLNIVSEYYGGLPAINSFTMFKVCSSLFRKIPSQALKKLFITTIKKRKTNISSLGSFEKELRQLALAMQMNEKKYNYLLTRLNNPVKL